jgi:hypothetical protein
MKKAPFKLIALTIFSLLLLPGCGLDEESECVEQPGSLESMVQVDLINLQDEVIKIETREDMISFLNDNPVVAEIFLKRSQYPNDSVMVYGS